MPSPGTAVEMIMPPNALRKKIGDGVALEQIFTPEKIAACQKIANAAYSDMFREVLEAISRIEKAYARLEESPDNNEASMKEIATLAFSTQKALENLGLAFGSEIMKSLHDYVRSLPGCNVQDVNVALVLRKHIDILRARYRDGMKTDSNPMEQEILKNLKALVQKVKK